MKYSEKVILFLSTSFKALLILIAIFIIVLVFLLYQNEKTGKLVTAINKQDKAKIQFYMSELIDVNKQYYGFYGRTTLLQIACLRQNFSLIKELVNRGADVNFYNEDNLSPFTAIFAMGKTGKPLSIKEIIDTANFLS